MNEGVLLKSYFGGIVSRFLNKSVQKKTGVDPRISIDSLELKEEEGLVKANVSLAVKKENFDKLMEVIGG